MSKRRHARERVLQALYAHALSGDEAEHVIETVLKPAFEDDRGHLRFAEKLFLFTLDEQDAADALIQAHAQNWDLDRIAVLDRLVLRMGVAELLRFEDIPPKVTINEAIEVARAFSTDQSGRFVNGLLDAILRDLQRDGRLNKSGRGLVGTPAAG